MTTKKVYSLFEVTRSIQSVIQKAYSNKHFWIKAEIVRLNHYTHSGHCYPDLVEKRNGQTIAEIRGNIWRKDFQRINHKFTSILNEPLDDNMTVVVYGTVSYHPQYGLSLSIRDIDPEYTLGELARQKSETISRLKKEGIYAANKERHLAMIPKTIALISVNTSKGYHDFINVIQHNEYGYQFQHKLFPAILQGEKAITTISAQLSYIEKHKQIFDAVAIIRGGGGDVGLSSYDSYELAKAVATFPLPVLTGIGHSTNETVTDLVSYKSFITPTRIAEFFLQQFRQIDMNLQNRNQTVMQYARSLLEREHEKLEQRSKQFVLPGHILRYEKNHLQEMQAKIHHKSVSLIQSQKESLSYAKGKLDVLKPENALKRGYSISRIQGKLVSNILSVNKGDIVDIQLAGGSVKAEVKEIHHH
ncbi:MAG: exodeoxyribonuclease VII large subunit [Bacteroidales bacterium]